MKIRYAARNRGIALIIVMMVIVVLGLLAAAFAYSMKVETTLARNASSETELLWIGRSGVELARLFLGQKALQGEERSFDALNQRWAGGPGTTNDPLSEFSLVQNQLGPGQFSVTILDLERKLNINRASPEMIERALDLLGYDSLEATIVVDSIEDWKDPNDLPQPNGAESEDYLSLPRPYVAKDAPLDDLSELLLVRGVTPEMYWGPGRTNAMDRWRLQDPSGEGRTEQIPPSSGLGLVDLFAVSLAQAVNINTAPREVLMLLPGMDDSLAEGIVHTRSGLDGIDGTEDDTPFHSVGELVNVGGMLPQFVQALGQVCTVRSLFFEARVQVQINAYRRVYVARLFRPNERTVQVLNAYWE